jgi:hypothetical protein
MFERQSKFSVIELFSGWNSSNVNMQSVNKHSELY